MKYGTKVIDNKIFYNDILITNENVEEISQSSDNLHILKIYY